MSMPTWQDILLPFLQEIQDGNKKQLRSITEIMIECFNLTDEERELKESNGQRKIHNNVSWASTHLAYAGLIRRPTRGFVEITGEGQKLLATGPNKISMKTLAQYPAYEKWRAKPKRDLAVDTSHEDQRNDGYEQKLNPVAAFETNARLLKEQLADELLALILDQQPDFLEKLVCDMMEAMGYGQAEVTGRSGDGGIDGIVKQDQLGFAKIFLQAKRRKENAVSSSEIRNFAGALSPGSKGVFVTTSDFTKDAQGTAESIDHLSLVLINGKELAKLMIEYNVGVSVQSTVPLKNVDIDYFNPEA